MNRHQFLWNLHRLVAPRTYLEIGVNDGRSLTLSRTRSVAVDPAFKITQPLRCNLHLVRSTSDKFFEQQDPLRHLRHRRGRWRAAVERRLPIPRAPAGTRLDLAFIDGMHLFEFALRDFMNTERYADWSSVIVLDDMLPRNVDEAARDRHTGAWTGDVFKLIPVLERYRPDLVAIPVDTQPTGVLLVVGGDRDSRVLRSHYEEIVAEWVIPDPQRVPAAIIERRGAVAPEAVLGVDFWKSFVRARDRRISPDDGRRLVRSGLAVAPRPTPPSER